MTVTSIDIDQNELRQATQLAGTKSNRETVDLAPPTLIAVRRRPAAVERIIARRFEPDQINPSTEAPPTRERPGPLIWSTTASGRRRVFARPSPSD